MSEFELREEICDIGRRLYARGFVSANEGNLSTRIAPHAVLCTPTLISKGFMKPTDLAIVNMSGEQRSGPRPRTSEIKLHLSIYQHRPDVKAVIHTHPPSVTAFAITGTPIPTNIHPEIEFFVGPVPTAPYETPGTQTFADAIVPFLEKTSAVVLQNHGLVTFGKSLEWAWFMTEIVEGYCRLLIAARSLGAPMQLNEHQMSELLAMKATWGLTDPRTHK